MEANEPKDAADLARNIQGRCRQWFDASRTGIEPPITVSILFTELSLVEVHLNGDATSTPTMRLERQILGFQYRGEIITSIDQRIKKYPELEAQLRSDLDRLWAMYQLETLS